MPVGSYDLIVLGNDLAGLVSATLCAAKGMRVLLARTERRPYHYDIGSQRLPTEPLLLCGIESNAFGQVFEELHFEHLLRRKLSPVSPPLQLCAPDLRLDLDPADDAMDTALHREIGELSPWAHAYREAEEAIESLFSSEHSLPPSGFRERRSVTRLAQAAHEAAAAWLSSPHGERMDELVDLCRSHMGADIEGEAEELHTAWSYAALRSGALHLEGGMAGLVQLLEDKFKSHNGELQRIHPGSIQTSWGKVSGLQTLEGELLMCDQLIAAMPASELLELFPKKPPKRLVELAESCRAVACRYTLNLIVHASAIPEGMADLVLSQSTRTPARYRGEQLLIQVEENTSTGRAVVTASAIAPLDESGQPALAEAKKSVLEAICELMPFIEEHIEFIDSPHEELGTADKSPPKRSLKTPLAPDLLWTGDRDESLGFTALPPNLGPKNMHLANSQCLPLFGLAGQFRAAWQASQLASAGSSKRKSTGRPSVLSEATGSS